MNTQDPWQRLSAAARKCSRDTTGPTEMPCEFDTRVLARMSEPAGMAELWLHLAWRLVPLGAGVLLVCWLVLPTPARSPATPDLVEQLMQEILSP